MQKLAKALSIFREKINTVKKDASNPFFKSVYADLPSILDAIKPALKESGLAVFHNLKNDNGYSLHTTLIEIESGENVTSEFPVYWNKPQEVWSSITYARRYNLLSLLDIPTDEDDDGNTANNAIKTTKTVETPTWAKQYPRTRADDIMDEMKMIDDYEELKKLFTELYPLAKSDAQKKFYTSFYGKIKDKILDSEEINVFWASSYADTVDIE